ncbi:MAG: hypothetical protein LBK41_08490 [Clostridiales bacterium]|nr:hypothetical protein [Clostridiales bacterium]
MLNRLLRAAARALESAYVVPLSTIKSNPPIAQPIVEPEGAVGKVAVLCCNPSAYEYPLDEGT